MNKKNLSWLIAGLYVASPIFFGMFGHGSRGLPTIGDRFMEAFSAFGYSIFGFSIWWRIGNHKDNPDFVFTAYLISAAFAAYAFFLR